MRAGWIGSASASSRAAVALGGGGHGLLEAGHPRGPVGLAGDPVDGVRERLEDRGEVARDRAGQLGVPGDLGGGVGDVHDGGGGRTVLAAEDAVPEPEVERGADHDDQVAGAERLAAGLGDQQRVAAGDDAAAHAVGDRGDAEGVDQRERGHLGAVGPGVGAEDDHRALGATEQPGDRVHRARVVRGALDRAGQVELHLGAVEELVHRARRRTPGRGARRRPGRTPRPCPRRSRRRCAACWPSWRPAR